VAHTSGVTRNATAATALSGRVDRRSASTLLSNPHPLLIRTSLALALVFGFSVGFYLILGFAFGLPLAASPPALMQLHGQMQALGFVALFIMAVGVQLFPRFHSARLDRPWLVSLGGLVLAVGLVLRALTQPVRAPDAARAVGLVTSGILELVGVALAVYTFARVIGSSVQPGPRGPGALLPAAMPRTARGLAGLDLPDMLRLTTCSLSSA
jgi:hypothetical protein